jgi:hypothetical protein
MIGFLREKPLGSANALFLSTTILTSVTGYFFPFHGFKPSYVVGAISLVFLALAVARTQGRPRRRRLAQNVRHKRHDRALPQRLYFDCAALHESAGAKSTSAHGDRASFQTHAADRSRDLLHSHYSCGGSLSQHRRAHRLIV